MRELPSLPSQSRFHICLDDGADECKCACRRFESRGTVFDSRWYFEPLQSIALCITCSDPACQCRRKSVEGVVLDCRKVARDRYQTTLLFVDSSEGEATGFEEFSHIPG